MLRPVPPKSAGFVSVLMRLRISPSQSTEQPSRRSAGQLAETVSPNGWSPMVALPDNAGGDSIQNVRGMALYPALKYGNI
jgi:hypothetical protein